MRFGKLSVARAGTVLTIALLFASTAFAKDAIRVTASDPKAVVVNNGQAQGTIQLFYTVEDTQFTTGLFTTFDLDWLISQGAQPTNYTGGIAFNLVQDQNGGYVELVPTPDTFTITGAGAAGKSTVSVYITTDKNGNAPPSADGTDLVGNLKLDAGSKLGSVTNIQVHIRLVHPSNCLKVYNFVTDQDFALGVLNTANVKVNTSGSKKGLVASSQPGQFSDNVLVVNLCAAAQSFDLGVGLDSSFAVKPHGNPVVAYTAAGEFDTSNFGDLMLGTGTSYQQNLCLQNVTVPAGSTMLVTVHSEVIKDLPGASLPADKSFDFAASLYQTVNAGCTGPLDSLASPNAAPFALPFTVNGY